MNELMRKILFLPEQALDLRGGGRPPPLLRHHRHHAERRRWWRWRPSSSSSATGAARRTRPPPTSSPRPSTRSSSSAVPLVFFLLWFAIGFPHFVRLHTPPKDAMDVYVQGKKWMWKFAYPGGPNGVDVLRVPAGRPVRLLITSRDVIHSFYVPDLPPQAGRAAGPLHRRPGSRPPSRARYQVLLRRVLRPGPLGHAGRGGGAAAGGVRRLARRSSGAAPWPGRRTRPADAALVPPAASLAEQGRSVAAARRAASSATPWTARAHRPHLARPLPAAGEARRRARRCVADEAYLTESMMDPGRQGGRGLPERHAHLPGPAARPRDRRPSSSSSSRCARDVVQPEPPKGPVYDPVPGFDPASGR